jgi:predicted O-methyltransferase YrrM
LSHRPIQFLDVHSARAAVPRVLHHPFFSWAGLRPLLAQHTSAEHQALQRYAGGSLEVVEIGVAEGASAIALRDGMDRNGNLYLIDPYHLSRVRPLNFLRRAAQRAVSSEDLPKTIWIERFSHDAAKTWSIPIDFLMIDGDHAETAVQTDWEDWHGHVTGGGIVAFHDARLFPSGWTSPVYGPVKFINRFFRETHQPEWEIIDEVDSLVFLRRDCAAGPKTTKAGV